MNRSDYKSLRIIMNRLENSRVLQKMFWACIAANISAIRWW